VDYGSGVLVQPEFNPASPMPVWTGPWVNNTENVTWDVRGPVRLHTSLHQRDVIVHPELSASTQVGLDRIASLPQFNVITGMP